MQRKGAADSGHALPGSELEGVADDEWGDDDDDSD